MPAYAPRLMRSHDVVELSAIRFKPYSIAAAGREDMDIAPALEAAAASLAASEVPGLDHLGLGYIVYHAGEEGNWLLTRTWLGGGIVSGLLGQLTATGYRDVAAPLVECVWEEVPVHHEREAWVRHMMAARPDPEAYLGDRLAEGYR